MKILAVSAAIAALYATGFHGTTGAMIGFGLISAAAIILPRIYFRLIEAHRMD